MWQRIKWAWRVARYGETLAHAWLALENFERTYGQKRNVRDLMSKHKKGVSHVRSPRS